MKIKGGVLFIVCLIFLVNLVSAVNLCNDAKEIIFRLSSETNAHGEVYNGAGRYQEEICYNQLFVGDGDGTRTCNGNNLVVRLSGSTNAHAEERTRSLYSTEVCYLNLDCRMRNTCLNDEAAVSRLSAKTNAHLETSRQSVYSSASGTLICCKSAPLGNDKICNPACPPNQKCIAKNTCVDDDENPDCDDGIDNDGDGRCDTAGATCTDGSLPGDPQCTGPEDDNEGDPQCNDDVDNDRDDLIDFPNDPGCTNANDDDESDDGVLPVCGNRKIETGEECDDGNTISDDGCSYPDCKVEPPYTCTQEPSICCNNDNIVTGTEECDDMNTNPNDLCNLCVNTYCGDGHVQTPNAAGVNEECDDGKTVSGGGCSSSCRNEGGVQAVCGNGIKEGVLEQCDDGGLCTGDDSTFCKSNADCSSVGGTCTPRSGDGCSSTCIEELCCICTEPGPNDPSICYQCGDNVLNPETEECEIVDGKAVFRDFGDGVGQCTAYNSNYKGGNLACKPQKTANRCKIDDGSCFECNVDSDCLGNEICTSGKCEDEKPECSDKIDNDNDGDVDFPDDKDCDGPNDDSEVSDAYWAIPGSLEPLSPRGRLNIGDEVALVLKGLVSGVEVVFEIFDNDKIILGIGGKDDIRVGVNALRATSNDNGLAVAKVTFNFDDYTAGGGNEESPELELYFDAAPTSGTKKKSYEVLLFPDITTSSVKEGCIAYNDQGYVDGLAGSPTREFACDNDVDSQLAFDPAYTTDSDPGVLGRGYGCGDLTSDGVRHTCICKWEGSRNECLFTVRSKSSPGGDGGFPPDCVWECSPYNAVLGECKSNGKKDISFSGGIFDDPNNCAPSLRSSCESPSPYEVSCGALQLQLPFFGFIQIILSLMVIAWIHCIVAFRRKN